MPTMSARATRAPSFSRPIRWISKNARNRIGRRTRPTPSRCPTPRPDPTPRRALLRRPTPATRQILIFDDNQRRRPLRRSRAHTSPARGRSSGRRARARQRSATGRRCAAVARAQGPHPALRRDPRQDTRCSDRDVAGGIGMVNGAGRRPEGGLRGRARRRRHAPPRDREEPVPAPLRRADPRSRHRLRARSGRHRQDVSGHGHGRRGAQSQAKCRA